MLKPLMIIKYYVLCSIPYFFQLTFISENFISVHLEIPYSLIYL